MNTSDEIVSAYADGELSQARKKRFEDQPDAELCLRIKAKKIRRLDALLKRAFPLEADIPQRLIETVTGRAGQTDEAANVIPIGGRGRKNRPRPGYWKPASLAASVTLMIGAIAGSLLLTDDRQAALAPTLAAAIKPGVEFRSGNELHGVLEYTPSAASVRLAQNGVVFEPVLSFKGTDGHYCREFDLHYELETVSALACRADDASWRLTATAAGATTGQAYDNDYQLASGQDAEALDTAIDRLMAGAPLSKEEEQRLIARQWQPES